MDRNLILAFVLALASSGADATTVYRCRTAHGLSYQDQPCADRSQNRKVVSIGEPVVVQDTHSDNLGEWAEQTGQENRRLELQARAQRLQRENRAAEAEFAVMVEEIERQKDPAAQSVAGTPSVGELQQRQYQLKREYSQRIQRNNAELQDVQAQLSQP